MTATATAMGTTTAIFYTLCAFHGVAAFYLPGLAPVNYCKAGEVTPTCKVHSTRNREGGHSVGYNRRDIDIYVVNCSRFIYVLVLYIFLGIKLCVSPPHLGGPVNSAYKFAAAYICMYVLSPQMSFWEFVVLY